MTSSELPRSGPSLVAVALFVAAVVGGGFLSSLFYSPEPGDWYEGLNKSELTPPSWVFPVAWTALYALIGVAVARVYAAEGAPRRELALGLFAAQLALNYAWTYVFFELQAFDFAVWHTSALLAVALAAALAMGAVDRLAGWLMAPYCAWILFADYLTYVVAAKNPNWVPV